jgi:hypothetical protein
MYKPESSQRASAKGVILKRRDDNSLCVTNDYMSNCAISVNENANLATCFRREFRKIFCKFRGNYLIMYPSPVDPLKGVKVTGFKS